MSCIVDEEHAQFFCEKLFRVIRVVALFYTMCLVLSAYYRGYLQIKYLCYLSYRYLYRKFGGQVDECEHVIVFVYGNLFYCNNCVV